MIAALRKTSGVDFSQYRDTTIKRRTARRMLLRGVKSPVDYAQLVERDRTEAEALFRDVLINVTSFFRDPGMFEDLQARGVSRDRQGRRGVDAHQSLGAWLLDGTGSLFGGHRPARIPRG